MLEVLKPFAYLAFHAVIWGSFLVGKLSYPKMKFPTVEQLKKALPISGLFILWDILVTHQWWDFADQYTLFKLGPLPIEEYLFFGSIPFATLVLTENLRQVPRFQHSKPVWRFLSHFLRIPFFILAGWALFQGWQYTAVVALLLAVSVRPADLADRVFLSGLGITVLLTFGFNLYLTSVPIVTYNQLYKSGWQILSIPLEDFWYGALFYIYVYRSCYGNSQLHHSPQTRD